MNRVDECGTGGSILPFSLPVPDPSSLVTCGAFGGPAAAQAEFTGAYGKCQLEVFFENLTHENVLSTPCQPAPTAFLLPLLP